LGDVDAYGWVAIEVRDYSAMTEDVQADMPASFEEPTDSRFYLPRPEGWEVHIQTGGEREYCHFKNPGDEHFHLIVAGEVYLRRGDDLYCLNCARRYNVITSDRLYWQRSGAEHA